ncbi:uncharacterized protein EAE98_003244 [Botrytis deweyae]|uniref:Uncharacterized protein n=1 Tax=Botrytis deweyae TaxID=2478750 RepID=A0ABQ7IT25_9HELO|nr:uncharacterized protein EAE98_003244 [Botrytis deweyae]KAF7933535.1 hypothetical protein EAE98_003244 [Botrytis deweyae]
MTIHNPPPSHNLYNAPTQPAYAVQSGNRTIPIPLGQGQGVLHGSAGIGATGGTRLGSVQNANASGGAVASSGGRTGHGGSARAASGQSAVRGVSQGRNQTHGGGNGNGNGGGASQHVNASGMQAQAQVQHPHIPSNHMNGQAQIQHQQTPVNYVHPFHHPQAHHPPPHNPMNHIQPLVGGIFGPHAPHIPHPGRTSPYIPLLSRLGPYVPRTRGARFPTPNLRGHRPAYGPPMQLPCLPVPFGFPAIGNVNAGGMGLGNGGMVVNGWDSRWDGSGGDRGRGNGLRGGRDRRRR